MQIGVSTNPNSRKNRGQARRVDALRSIVGNLGEVHETPDVDSIKPILREFLRKRARYWVADGGDGALHWMVRNGLEILEEEEFAKSGATLPLTLPTRGGTIDFVANNVGLEGDAEDILGSLRGAVEAGRSIEEVEVDAMLIEGVEATDEGDQPFRTYGFASAAGGIGQRFFTKYYEEPDPNPSTIVKVIANTVASIPIALSPLRMLPGTQHLRDYASHMFRPTTAQITMDGMVLPFDRCTGIHIASMSINLGNVFRFFSKADQPGLMHALVGSPSPVAMFLNIPRMHLGMELRDNNLVDRACREMTMEATGKELLDPVIDGELYRNLRKVTFKIGPRVRIPKVVTGSRRN
jgi:diacylglycerol kinase family enzyme